MSQGTPRGVVKMKSKDSKLREQRMKTRVEALERRLEILEHGRLQDLERRFATIEASQREVKRLGELQGRGETSSIEFNESIEERLESLERRLENPEPPREAPASVAPIPATPEAPAIDKSDDAQPEVDTPSSKTTESNGGRFPMGPGHSVHPNTLVAGLAGIAIIVSIVALASSNASDAREPSPPGDSEDPGFRLSRSTTGSNQVARGFGVEFRGSNLTGIDFRGAVLTHANLDRATLRYADFCGANLFQTRFRSADLSHANMRDARLENADFRGARLLEVDFAGADLDGVDFEGALVSTEDWLDNLKAIQPPVLNFAPDRWAVEPESSDPKLFRIRSSMN